MREESESRSSNCSRTSAVTPDFRLARALDRLRRSDKRLIKEPLRNPPGTRFTYSDIGFIALGEVVARVSQMPLDQFAAEEHLPLRMTSTGFRPSASAGVENRAD